MHLTLNEQYTGSDININIVECKYRKLFLLYNPKNYININIVECKWAFFKRDAKGRIKYKYKHSGM